MEEAESNNLFIFRAAISKIFQDIAHSVSQEEFLKTFTILGSKPSVVKILHKVMEEELLKGMNEVLETLVTEECIVKGMKEVAKLSEDTTISPSVTLWRPPGNVNLHLRSLDAEKMLKECEKLESYISNMQKENETLKEKVTERRKSILSINNRTKSLLNMPWKLSELENTVKFNQECAEKLYKQDSFDDITNEDK